MGIDLDAAWRLTPWEFECYSKGWMKNKYHEMVTLLRGLGESMSSQELWKSLFGIESDKRDDELMAISEGRAHKARVRHARIKH